MGSVRGGIAGAVGQCLVAGVSPSCGTTLSNTNRIITIPLKQQEISYYLMWIGTSTRSSLVMLYNDWPLEIEEEKDFKEGDKSTYIAIQKVIARCKSILENLTRSIKNRNVAIKLVKRIVS